MIAKWRRRFSEGGVEGSVDEPLPGAPWKLTARVRARVLAATRGTPPDGTRHWSCHRFAVHLGVSENIVQGVWCEAELRSDRLAPYIASTNPDFDTSGADIIGFC